jgi:hypothetical protein
MDNITSSMFLKRGYYMVFFMLFTRFHEQECVFRKRIVTQIKLLLYYNKSEKNYILLISQWQA